MAFEFTKDRKTYFTWQYRNAVESIVPFVKNFVALGEHSRILEVGCNDGGVLKAFTELGCTVAGVDVYEPGIAAAKLSLEPEIRAGQAQFIAKDIYRVDPETDLGGKFDLIILKDVLEHIPRQNILMQELPRMLLPGGKIFLGFPPWQMPFGGHQQGCQNYFLSRLPFFHLLPKGLYRKILVWAREPDKVLEELMNVYDTRISIEDFERICREQSHQILKKIFYLINPIYEYKFGLKTRVLWGFLGGLPFLRNFLTTSAYYLVEPGRKIMT